MEEEQKIDTLEKFREYVQYIHDNYDDVIDFLHNNHDIIIGVDNFEFEFRCSQINDISNEILDLL